MNYSRSQGRADHHHGRTVVGHHRRDHRPLPRRHSRRPRGKPYGSSTWKRAGTVLAPQTTWALRKSVAPLKQASYRWHFLGTESGAESFSPITTVKVKTALNATVADRTLRRGQNLVVTGRTQPAKPGSSVTLWRKTASGSIALACSRVRSDGTYQVAYPVNRTGTRTVHTTIPAVSGNLAGRSR